MVRYGASATIYQFAALDAARTEDLPKVSIAARDCIIQLSCKLNDDVVGCILPFGVVNDATNARFVRS